MRTWLTILRSDTAWVALPNHTYVAACYFHGPFAVPVANGSVPDEAVVVVAKGGPESMGPVGFHGRMKLARPHP